MDAAVDEIFLSLQGEGVHSGQAQLFLRLGGCPLRCDYCDTPDSLHAGERIDAKEVTRQLHAAAQAHGCKPEQLTLSVTGGEPLLQASFLEAWLPSWEGPVLLETSGVLPQALARVLPRIDFLSLDWKLESTLREGQEILEREACVAAAKRAKVDFQLKLVVTERTEENEVLQALQTLQGLAPACPVILQPVTPIADGPKPPDGNRLTAWCLAGLRLGLDMRVLPQIHPHLGIR